MFPLLSIASRDELAVLDELTASMPFICDLKDPDAGSLAAPSPDLLAHAVHLARRKKFPLSVALGDISVSPGLTGTIALAASAVMAHQVAFAKLGLFSIEDHSAAEKLLNAVRKAKEHAKAPTALIAGCYADRFESAGLYPEQLIELASSARFDGILIDTAAKDSRCLLDILSRDELRAIAALAHERHLTCAYAGSLHLEHLSDLAATGVDFVGFRGALTKGARTDRIDSQAVSSLLVALQDYAKPA